MTDYLARAMEQDEERDRELPEELEAAGTVRVLRPRGEGPASTAGPGPGQSIPAVAEAAAERRGRAGETALPGRRAMAETAEAVPGETRQVSPLLTETVRVRGRSDIGPSPESPAGRGDREVAPPLLRQLRQAWTGTDFVRRERRSLSVTLPEAPAVAGSLSAEELDRTVERDARRYDGGFTLY